MPPRPHAAEAHEAAIESIKAVPILVWLGVFSVAELDGQITQPPVAAHAVAAMRRMNVENRHGLIV